jgi:hypothetical protein
MIRNVRIAMGAGLIALLIGISAVMLQHPTAVARTNGASSEKVLGNIGTFAKLCEGHELIPRGTTALVLWLSAATGPRLTVQVVSNGVTVSRGERSSGWTGRGVTVSLDRPIHRSVEAEVCFEALPKNERIYVYGSHPSGAKGTRAGVMRVEYLRRVNSTWLSHSGSIARNLGFGRLPSGSWAPIVVILLGVAVIVGVSGLVASGLR